MRGPKTCNLQPGFNYETRETHEKTAVLSPSTRRAPRGERKWTRIDADGNCEPWSRFYDRMTGFGRMDRIGGRGRARIARGESAGMSKFGERPHPDLLESRDSCAVRQPRTCPCACGAAPFLEPFVKSVQFVVRISRLLPGFLNFPVFLLGLRSVSCFSSIS